MYRQRWYELPAEVALVLFSGLLTYMICRAFSLSKIAAITAGAASMLGMVLLTYYAHRFRAMHLESLPPDDRVALAWQLVRHALSGSMVALLAAGFGFLGIYLIWRGDLFLGLVSVVAGLALSLLGLRFVKRGWPEPPRPQ